MISLVVIIIVLWAFLSGDKPPEKPSLVSTNTKDFDEWIKSWWVPKTRYVEFVNAAAIRTGVPQPLIEAILWVESKDGRETHGSKGEIGAMQILPNTVIEIKRAWPTLADADVNTIGGNIMLGAAYLRMGYERHHSWRKATIGYNAGHSSPRVENVDNDEYLAKVVERLREILR